MTSLSLNYRILQFFSCTSYCTFQCNRPGLNSLDVTYVTKIYKVTFLLLRKKAVYFSRSFSLYYLICFRAFLHRISVFSLFSDVHVACDRRFIWHRRSRRWHNQCLLQKYLRWHLSYLKIHIFYLSAIHLCGISVSPAPAQYIQSWPPYGSSHIHMKLCIILYRCDKMTTGRDEGIKLISDLRWFVGFVHCWKVLKLEHLCQKFVFTCYYVNRMNVEQNKLFINKPSSKMHAGCDV